MVYQDKAFSERPLRQSKFVAKVMSLWFVTLVVCSGVARAIPVIEDPVFTALSTQAGLSQDSVNALQIDSDGFLWIGTEGGLNRWDGYRLTQIHGPNSELTAASITGLYEDKNKGLWVSTAVLGTYHINLDTGHLKQVLEIAYPNDASFMQEVTSIVEAPSGVLYVSLTYTILRYDPNSEATKILFEIDPEVFGEDTYIRELIWVDDKLLVGTTTGLYAMDPKQPAQPPKKLTFVAPEDANLENQNVKTFALTQDAVWIGTVEGLYRVSNEDLNTTFLDPQSSHLDAQRVVPARNIWAMVQKRENQFYLGTDIGLLELTIRGDKWSLVHLVEPQNNLEPLSYKDIRAIEIDQDNNLWLGSLYAGALYWSPLSIEFSTIQSYRWDKENPPLSSNIVWAVYQDSMDTMWVGTDNGLNYYSFAEGTSQQFLTSHVDGPSRNSSNIAGVAPAPNGNLFVETLDGIRHFNPYTKELSTPNVTNREDAEDVFNDWSYGMNLDAKGRLFFINNGMFRYDPKTEELESFALPESVENQLFINDFMGVEPRYNNRMMLSAMSGVWLVDPDTFEMQLVHQLSGELRKALPGAASWVIDDFNTLWIAYPGYGLVGLDADTFEQHTVLNRGNLLSDVNVYGLMLDENGNLWFSSHAGLHRYSPLKQAIDNFRYGQELTVAEFNQGANAQLLDGRMVFGSPKGLVVFSPQRINQYAEIGGGIRSQSMSITGIHLQSRQLDLAGQNYTNRTINLNHDDYGLTIDYSPMLFSLVGEMSFRYTLSRGNDIISQVTTADGQATFPVLQPGDYRFEVAPVAQRISTTILPAQVTFTLPYAPFQSPFAYTVYGITLIAIFVLYMTRRQLQLNRLARAQQQIRVLGEAFRQTRDWVIVFDEERRPIAANPAFARIFSIDTDKALESQIKAVLERVPVLRLHLQDRLATLGKGDFYKQEEIIETPGGRKYDVLIELTSTGPELSVAKGGENSEHYMAVMTDISEQKRAERKLQKLANYDALTGLVNRSLLLDRLEHAIANADYHKASVAVLFVDLDRFKAVNDTLGHDYGDKLLRVVASRMLNLASSHDTVARLGGDEFVIVIEEVREIDELTSFISQLIGVVEAPITIGREVLRVSCSVGVSFYPDDGTDAAELLKLADVAMYAAKKDTLSGFAFFTESMNTMAKARLQLENQVKQSVQDDSYVNFYQPIVNLETGRTEGVELLLRCPATDPPLYPNQFIPVLEELRYIIDVTRSATERAIKDLAQWYKSGFNGYVSINLSALHFKTEFDIPSLLAQLKKHGLGPEVVRFEITEGILMDNHESVYRQITLLQEAGFLLALDDFGTGYSSLSYLKRFPLKVLKIDKSFVDDIEKDNENNALVTTTIQLAKSLSMTCVAEGIESPGQARFLLDNGCPLQQGYHFSRPVPADALEALLHHHWQLPRN